MKRLGLVLTLVACGSSSPPPAAHPSEPASSSSSSASVAASSAPVPVDREGCMKAYDEARYETATKCFRALHTESKDPTYLLLLGRTYERAGDRPHAVDAYSEYVASEGIDPNERRSTELRIRLLKEKIAVAQGAQVLYEHGKKLEDEGRWEEAASAYQRYLFAKGDSLSYIDRSSMELRIKLLREKAATSRPAESPRR